MQDLVLDVRYGLRLLRRSPLFTAIAVATLALAIGANTAVFSIVNVMMLRPLAVTDPGSLVQFTWQYPRDPPLNMFGPADYERYRDHNTVFSDIVGLARFAPESRDGTEPVNAEVVTGNFFQGLGVRAALGRVMDRSDDQPGAAPVAVVSTRYWKRRFNGGERGLGGAIEIRDPRIPLPVHATVVGVASADFTGVTAGYQTDVWVSLASIPDAMRSRVALSLIARLRPGASIEQARAEMRALDQQRIDGFAQRDPVWRQVRLEVKPAAAGLDTPLHDQFGRPIQILMLLVGVMLLLACANIGSLLLARGAGRQREMAVRISLGAGRARIARQVLTESILLAAAGSLTGLLAAPLVANALMRVMAAGARALTAVPPPAIPLDRNVLLFAIAVAVVSTVVFAFLPAIAAHVAAPARALTQNGGGTPSKAQRRGGRAMVAAQVALSLVLLTVAWLYAAHLASLRDRSLGFDRSAVLLVSVDAAPSGYSREQLHERGRDLLARLAALPGVRSATTSGMTPISGAAGSRFMTVPGFVEPLNARRRVFLNSVGPRFFATYRTPLLAGRDFEAGDEGGAPVAIVNQTLARHYFPGGDPVGREVSLEGTARPLRIVGVVADAKYQDVRTAAPPTLYFFALQQGGFPTEFSLRADVTPASLTSAVQRVVDEVLKGARIRHTTTLSDQVDAAIVPERLLAMLSGFFGGLGALLAALGLYGLVAYTVTRRTREIGIRMALGATRADIVRMVLADAGRLVAAGLLLGVPAAFWGQRIAATMLENLPAGGLVPMAVAATGTIVVAIVAATIPARRATRVAPVVALRTE